MLGMSFKHIIVYALISLVVAAAVNRIGALSPVKNLVNG
jgi:hypothetical protein